LRSALRWHKDKHIHDKDDIQELGLFLGMKNPNSFTWNMRHGNHGILIFEERDCEQKIDRELLENIVALLSLC